MVNEEKIDKIKNGAPFSLLDIIAIIFALSLSIILIIVMVSNRVIGNTVVITHKDQVYRYDLNVDKEIVLNTEAGNYVIVIEKKSVYVKESNCPDKYCLAMPPIMYKSQYIACPPLRIYITIEGEGDLVAVI